MMPRGSLKTRTYLDRLVKARLYFPCLYADPILARLMTEIPLEPILDMFCLHTRDNTTSP